MPLEDQTPAAEYLRMSTKDQKYSIPVQQAAIRQYAADHGFVITRTYADPGKSGVVIKRRDGLGELLRDVVGGRADYKAVLVYDVNRWGRFQNPDEAAHYEFICARAGVPVHYCAEPFANDGSLEMWLMKALKRGMAGEYSRELGVKVYEAVKRLVLQGFHAGAAAPYGLARMLLSPSGHRKGILKQGERKNLKTDRVVLVRGKRGEVELVRRIFHMCADESKTCPQIAAELNSEHLTYRGKSWTCDRISQILRLPQYLGLNVWAKRTQRLYSPSTLRPRNLWVTSKAPFKPIVDQATFDRASRKLASHRVRYNSPALLRHLKRVLKRNGRLSFAIVDRGRGPSASTYMKRFGSLLTAYEQVGYEPSQPRYAMREHYCDHVRFRKLVLSRLQGVFGDEVRIVRSARQQKGCVEVDGHLKVSVLICGKCNRIGKAGQVPWLVRLLHRDRENLLLICMLDSRWKKVVGYYLLKSPGNSVKSSHRFYRDDLWLTRSGRRLKDDLSDFCEAARTVVRETGPSGPEPLLSKHGTNPAE